MKKILFLLLASVMTTAAWAQFTGSRFLDNWSLTLQGGAVSPTTVPCSGFLNHARGVAGLALNKQLTPVWTLSAEAMTGFNTTGSTTALDNVTAMAMAHVNLTNLFARYQGSPRLFEVEGVAGVGIDKYFGYGAGHQGLVYAVAADGATTFAAKAGVNFLLNLGQKRAWTLNLRPMLVWETEGGYQTTHAQLNVNNSVVELTAGVTYHFLSGNRQHHMTRVRAYDQGEVDALNAKINALHGTLGDRQAALSMANDRVQELEAQISELRNQKPQVVERVKKGKDSQSMEQTITFRQGKSVVEPAQLPNVERVATFMRNHKHSTVSIKGYASPEGSAEINARLAQARADAVKAILTSRYGISGSRIQSEGQGVGNMFSEPDWNRVSICTLSE